jgi:hypothetical protein
VVFETAFEHRGQSSGFLEVRRAMASDIRSIDAESDLAGRNHFDFPGWMEVGG